MDLTPDPLFRRLAGTVRARLAAAEDAAEARAALRGIEAPAFEAPVGAGGFDLGLACGVVVCSELGRRALPDVHSGPSMALDAMASSGTAEAAEAATALAAGDTAVHLAGFDLLGAPAERSLHAVPDGGALRLSGTVSLPGNWIPGAHLLVPQRTGAGVRLVLLPEDRVRDRTRPAPGGRLVELTGLVAAEAEQIGDLGDGTPSPDPDGVLGRARVRAGAYLYGLALGAQDLAVRHAGSRQQFGAPIVTRQAVAFPLARQRIALGATRLALLEAAWHADADEPFSDLAVEALALAAETATRVVRTALQIHGARGMSLGEPVHAHYLLLPAAVRALGAVSVLWREAGRRRLAAVRVRVPAP
ncbi:acyl-CoA dehydrogenase family protein [Actinosynnema sp. NPDC047251]|uniref:Acyl-CoA dehydrogenase domain protein n=1 Tax=Saccharothrix espanaensis (strain ATCC 51144 / DSM 44229 / JCM 9112 / NBRC 15066 / NRRL 15764) TaxID=1179773 RepID=K0K3N6_SACES|nr:acyl-CoA dehydrogenase family protein [Saccharothrix espanaensis]CCH32936.1 Acyl-CoA dehydrogenase domain protein [Saccharothrix espanaensis DSM 44229]